MTLPAWLSESICSRPPSADARCGAARWDLTRIVGGLRKARAEDIASEEIEQQAATIVGSCAETLPDESLLAWMAPVFSLFRKIHAWSARPCVGPFHRLESHRLADVGRAQDA